MPEDLPTPKKSLKQLEKENKRSLKKKENLLKSILTAKFMMHTLKYKRYLIVLKRN